MTDASAGQVSTRAAELFERFFVPALFGPWPARLLDLVDVRSGETVLDVGCGTGVLARTALDRVGPRGAVTGLDPNQGMLAVAARLAPEVTWLEAVAEEVPMEDGSVDVVACEFALMFFADRSAAMAEFARVLRPGGRLVVATWAELPAIPAYDALVGLLRRVVGDAAADALSAPFTIGTPDALRRIVVPVFPGARVETREGRARFPSVEAWLTTEIKAWTIEDLVSDGQLAQLLAEAPRVLSGYSTSDGRVDFASSAQIAIASRP